MKKILLTMAVSLVCASAFAHEKTCTSANRELTLRQTLIFGGAPPPPDMVRPHWYLRGVEIDEKYIYVDSQSEKVISTKPVEQFYTEVIYTVRAQVQLEGPAVPGWTKLFCKTYQYSGQPIP